MFSRSCASMDLTLSPYPRFNAVGRRNHMLVECLVPQITNDILPLCNFELQDSCSFLNRIKIAASPLYDANSLVYLVSNDTTVFLQLYWHGTWLNYRIELVWFFFHLFTEPAQQRVRANYYGALCYALDVCQQLGKFANSNKYCFFVELSTR